MSKGRKDGVVILGGDAAGEEDEVYEASQTLIAIGTQAGKVMVFNVLGLLVHDVVLSAPIVSVEWVGDMSASSILPNRTSSLSPEPRPVVDLLLEDISSLSEHESGTMTKRALSHDHPEARRRISIGPDLFSEEIDKCTSIPRPLQNPSDVRFGSPLQVKRTRKRKQRLSSVRPRIATETFRSPTASPACSSIATKFLGSVPNETPLQDIHRRSKIGQDSTILIPNISRRFSSPQKPSSLSSQHPNTSDEEFYTAPSTKQGNGKTHAQLTSSTREAIETPPAQVESANISSPASLNSPSGLHSRSASRFVKNAFVRDRIDGGVWQRRRTSVALETPQRRVTVDARQSPSPLDTLASRFSRKRSNVFERAPTNTQDRSAERSPRRFRGSALLEGPKRQMTVQAHDTPSSLATPQSVYSRTKSQMLSRTQSNLLGEVTASPAPSNPQRQDTIVAPDTPSSSVNTPTGLYSQVRASVAVGSSPSTQSTVVSNANNNAPGDLQRRPVVHRSETPPWLSSPTSLPSPPSSRILRDAPRPTSNTHTAAHGSVTQQKTPAADNIPSDFSSPTSLYSRPSSRMFRSSAKEAITIHTETADHHTPCDLESSIKGDLGQGDIPAQREDTIRSVGEEIRRLRDDGDVLRREVHVLRDEVQALRERLVG